MSMRLFNHMTERSSMVKRELEVKEPQCGWDA